MQSNDDEYTDKYFRRSLERSNIDLNAIIRDGDDYDDEDEEDVDDDLNAIIEANGVSSAAIVNATNQSSIMFPGKSDESGGTEAST